MGQLQQENFLQIGNFRSQQIAVLVADLRRRAGKVHYRPSTDRRSARRASEHRLRWRCERGSRLRPAGKSKCRRTNCDEQKSKRKSATHECLRGRERKSNSRSKDLQAASQRFPQSALRSSSAECLKIFFCQCVTGIELQSSIQVQNGLLRFAKFGKCCTEIGFGSGIVGFELYGSRELLHRSGKISRRGLRDSQVVVRIEIFGTSGGGGRQMRDGFRDLIRSEKRATQSVLNCGVSSAKRKRRLVLLHGFARGATQLQHRREIIVRLKIIGIILDVMSRQ